MRPNPHHIAPNASATPNARGPGGQGAVLGLIAGQGALPIEIIKSCKASGRPIHVIGLRGQASPNTLPWEQVDWFRLGAAGKIIKSLKKATVSDLVLAGGVQKPSVTALFPDIWALRFLLANRVYHKGDDALLSRLLNALETGEGFHIVSAQSIVPHLLAPHGQLGAIAPLPATTGDIDIGLKAALELGRRDIGQAVVVDQGAIIAREDQHGTAAMLADLVARKREGGEMGPSGILVKAMKPQQDPRVDLPSIGPETVSQAFRAGLAGIAVEAGQSFILDRASTIAAADKAGLFIVGVHT